MLPLLAPIALIAAAGLLVALAVIDCRHYILPDKLNALLAVAFIVFHLATGWHFITPLAALLGAAAGAGMLLLVRAAATKYYGEDALGLGDVKLMAAAGLGLGFPDIMLTLSLGAGLGMVHGLILGLIKKRRGEAVAFARINVPAGLGLCIGIFIMMVWRFGGVFL
jgi:leader peptidase (prepilin peptidase) / N-methyltransferase